jgi:hypothetical protein
MHLINARNMELSDCYTVVARCSGRGILVYLYSFKALQNPPGLSLYQTRNGTKTLHSVGREATTRGFLLLVYGYYVLAPWEASCVWAF